MVAHAIIVVGVSTGGLMPLRRIIEALPQECGASVFVVMHSGASPSILPEILGWHGRIAEFCSLVHSGTAVNVSLLDRAAPRFAGP